MHVYTRYMNNFCIIVGAPKIVGDLKDARVTPRDQASFTVEAVCEGPVTYVWQRKALNSTEWQEASPETKYEGQGTPSLVVTNVEKSDEGLIRCQIISQWGHIFTREAHLGIGEFSSLISHKHSYIHQHHIFHKLSLSFPRECD